MLLENFAIEWLRIQSAAIDWVRLMKYMETVARRTYENQPVALNLIIREGEGMADITEADLQKFFDRLASCLFVPYGGSRPASDGLWRSRMVPGQEPHHHQFHPEFLHPLHSMMKTQGHFRPPDRPGRHDHHEWGGLLAARRQRKWKLYDVGTFKNSLSRCLGNPHVGGNLFEVIFELSFRRQGALFVYDPDHCIRGHVLNSESIVFPGWKANGEAARAGLRPGLARAVAGRHGRGKEGRLARRRRRLIEMACGRRRGLRRPLLWPSAR